MGDIFMEICQEKFDRKLKEAVDQEVEKATRNLMENFQKSITESVTKEVTKKTKLMERISLIQKKCRKHKPLSVIANELETDLDELCPVYNIVFENTEKTVEELYELLTRGAVC